ncbi:hypothetical protein CHH62_13165 [Niallia circulans]|uniref:DUF262 domain-containing protein n=1 Tax=Niallia circulans TaxID=1397 RepID=UPI000BA5F06B|nr:DUF262 domain-containing protein [Niallia circulans]PAD25233.1 hypothetical protein CHH62_13165 [Niallia circulans]
MGIKNFGFDSVETYLQRGIYYIPDYQREYAWTKDDQVYDFWMDLESAVNEGRSNHFFGQVVIHDSAVENKKYIIDGQQRTSTSVIFLAVLRDLFNELHQTSNFAPAQNKFEDIRLKYIGRWSEEENELRLTLGNIDQNYFMRNIQIGKPNINTETEEASHKRIKEAYLYFEEQLRGKLFEHSEAREQYELLLKYYNMFLTNFRLMYVETDELNEAFIIFETLNARGKDLETSDLLKNHLFRTSGRSIEKIKGEWSKTVDNLDNIDITKFLRHFWNSKNRFVREKDLFKSIRSKVNTPKQCEAFMTDFYEMSEVYKTLVNPNDEAFTTDTKLIKVLKNLKIIKASSFYPIILALASNKYNEETQEGFLDEDITKVASCIESLLVRNCVVAGRVANKYEVLFADIAYSISEKQLISVNEICEKIKADTLNDEEFESSFKTLSIKSVTVAKYLLRAINDFVDPEVHVIEDNSRIHLEHIMPKSVGEWIIEGEHHKKYLNRIGNLTLLGNEYNRQLQNKVFDQKKQTYNRSSLNITKSLVQYDKWTIEDIEKRQDALFEIARLRWE